MPEESSKDEVLTPSGRELAGMLADAATKPGVADALELQRRMTAVAAASSQLPVPHSTAAADFTPITAD